MFLLPQTANLQEPLVKGQDFSKTKVIYFYRDSCSHCRLVKPIIEKIVEENQNNIDYYQYEVTEDQNNINLYLKFLNVYNIPIHQGTVPAVFIDENSLIGDKPITDNLEKIVLTAKSARLSLKGDLDKVIEDKGIVQNWDIEKRGRLDLGVVIGAALIDSINPCAIGVLLFLIAFLIAIKGSRKRILFIGSAYIFAVFLTYLLAGLGLLTVISVYNLGKWFKIIAGVILIIAGIIEVKDFFWSGRGISLKIPDRVKPILEKYLTKATIPAVLVAGVLVSAFELPCTGEVYLGILSLIGQNGDKLFGYLYLILYNIIFVLPLAAILLLAVFGIDIQRIKNVQSARKRWVRILLGLAMIALGIFLIRY